MTASRRGIGDLAQASSLAETLVGLADPLVDDDDIVELLGRLTASSVELLGAATAGILLDDQRGNLAVMASSTGQTRALDIQLECQQGPVLDCVRDARPVSCPDLGQELDRWPLFVPVAREAGFAALLAVPLRYRSLTIGALNLFHVQPTDGSPHDQRLAQALADMATIAIVQQRSTHRSTVLAEQLQQALNSRVVIEQAKGVLSERHGLTMPAAFDRLRRTARNGNRRLADVARSVVGGTDQTGSG